MIHLEKGKWLKDGKIESGLVKMDFVNLDPLKDKIKVMLLRDSGDFRIKKFMKCQAKTILNVLQNSKMWNI